MTLPLTTEADQEAGTADANLVGIGPTLKGLREARGVSPGEAADRLKFSLRQLDALETEKWENLPSGAPLRGFIRNYARFLEADVQALLSLLDNPSTPVGATSAVGPRARSLGPADRSMHDEPANRPWGWLIVILLLVFVAGFYAVERGWVPDSWLIFDWLKSLKK